MSAFQTRATTQGLPLPTPSINRRLPHTIYQPQGAPMPSINRKFAGDTILVCWMQFENGYNVTNVLAVLFLYNVTNVLAVLFLIEEFFFLVAILIDINV
ncbi:MAG: hypothetical protein HC865_17325 [Cyanobacteria bacterium RU_5_0]|nr:hypothetical protein [Cyanobacteria bacterium RU_5_0]